MPIGKIRGAHGEMRLLNRRLGGLYVDVVAKRVMRSSWEMWLLMEILGGCSGGVLAHWQSMVLRGR